jgi:predicted RNA-binding protein (virulence factor B family)
MLDQLGNIGDLEVVRESPNGVYLKLGKDEVLLPNKYVPEGIEPGQSVNVFIYKDSEDRPVATTLTPLGVVGDFVALEVIEVVPFGAFMDWGLEKHLLVPNSEMAEKMEVGKKYVVKIVLDYKTERLLGVGKLESFLSVPDNLAEGEGVRGVIFKKTDLGFKVVVDSQFEGLLYHNSIYTALTIGDTLNCYVDKIRTDGKVDLRLKKVGIESIDSDAETLLEFLKSHDGVTALTDKSSPAEIQEKMGLSKKAFKRAVGSLYKKRLLEITDSGLKLIS